MNNEIEVIEDGIDQFLNQCILPISASNRLREKVIDYLRSLVEATDNEGEEEEAEEEEKERRERNYDLILLPSGSTCTRTYLPDGDLDLILLSKPRTQPSQQQQQRTTTTTTTRKGLKPQQPFPSSSSSSTSSTIFKPIPELTLCNTLFTSFCNEITRKEEQQQPLLHLLSTTSSTSSSSSSSSSITPDMTIRNIELINARTKLLHCKVNNLDVDITFNQVNALFALVFMEKVDELIGNDHLLKRSLLLIKVRSSLSFFVRRLFPSSSFFFLLLLSSFLSFCRHGV